MRQQMRIRFLLVMASVVSGLSALAEPPAQLDCTIHSWNEHFKREKDHDYQHGYSATKVAPKDIEWLRPGASPVGGLGQVGPTYGFVVLGYCTKANITDPAELRNIMIKLSKLVSDHAGNAISYNKSGTEMRSISLDWKTKFMLLGNGATEEPLLLLVRPVRYQDRARNSFLIARSNRDLLR